jgi:hypothetical protein
MKLEKTLLAGLLTVGLGLGSTSCLGPDAAYASVKQWNADLSDKDWVNEVVYIGLNIIPVYPIVLFGDIVIFNTIRYWSGESTINDRGSFEGFTSKD